MKKLRKSLVEMLLFCALVTLYSQPAVAKCSDISINAPTLAFLQEAWGLTINSRVLMKGSDTSDAKKHCPNIAFALRGSPEKVPLIIAYINDDAHSEELPVAVMSLAKNPSPTNVRGSTTFKKCVELKEMGVLTCSKVKEEKSNDIHFQSASVTYGGMADSGWPSGYKYLVGGYVDFEPPGSRVSYRIIRWVAPYQTLEEGRQKVARSLDYFSKNLVIFDPKSKVVFEIQ